jgi:hypothetical protein
MAGRSSIFADRRHYIFADARDRDRAYFAVLRLSVKLRRLYPLLYLPGTGNATLYYAHKNFTIIITPGSDPEMTDSTVYYGDIWPSSILDYAL